MAKSKRNSTNNTDLMQNDVTESYKYILHQIARLKNVSVGSIQIVDHCCGEDTIFANGDWKGYVDDELLAEIDLIAEYDKCQRTESLQDFVHRKIAEQY